MRSKFVCVLVILCIMVFIKFFMAPYSITYKVNEFSVREDASRDIMYFEITYKRNVYNYMFFTKRKFTKKRVTNVDVKKQGNEICLTPIIKGIDSYTVCSLEEDKVNKEVLSFRKKNINEDFYYDESLNDDEYALIWKYDGFYYMNGKEQKSINIFDKDRYSNDLMYQANKYLIFPKYGNDYLFSDFIVLDMESGDYKTIITDYKINYSSKVVGEHKSSIFIFDSTNNKLYEINYKKKTCKLVGDEIKGYIKYVDGKKKLAKLDDYVKDGYMFFSEDNKYININKNYFNYKQNDDVRIKYYSDDDVRFVDNYEDRIYFVSNDNLYRYSNSGIDLIVHYFEFNFNDENIVYVYNK